MGKEFVIDCWNRGMSPTLDQWMFLGTKTIRSRKTYHSVPSKGVFKTLSNISNEIFCEYINNWTE